MIALAFLSAILVFLKPHLDRTRTGDVLLWYGFNKREFIYLFNITKF